MSTIPSILEKRVAVLVDCENLSPEILEYALKIAEQSGRVVLRRGYGNKGVMTGKWSEALAHCTFTPCLQYQYAANKNTSDIALALDALEAFLDRRTSVFFLVTSDSDFTCVCRKLRERNATVCIVGDPKTPEILRNAGDQFFEWIPPEPLAETASKPEPDKPDNKPAQAEPPKQKQPKPATKQQPAWVVEAVASLVSDIPEGKVLLGKLASHLRQIDPKFSHKNYGHSKLLNMVNGYTGQLVLTKEQKSGHWWVSLAPKAKTTAAKSTANLVLVR